MKFGQLIEHNMRNIFPQKSSTKCRSTVGESLNQQFEVSYSLFLLYVQVENYQNILKLKC